jgi:general L-amino acid transport system substrate-binding protein
LAGAVIAVLAGALVLPKPVSAITLETVRQRGTLNCGVVAGTEGFSRIDDQGVWKGLNVDICRATAAAVLGDAGKVTFVPLTPKNRLSALLSGEVDLLSMNISWDMSYDTSLGLHFGGVTFYDGQGFMVPVKLGVKSGLELHRTTVCLEPADQDTTKLADFFTSHNLEYRIVDAGPNSNPAEAFESGRCDVISGEISELYQLRLRSADPDQYQVLPDLISRRPLGPMVRQGDDGWFNVIRWVLFALVIAEDEGLDSMTIEQMQDSQDPDIRRLLGREGIGGKGLGLADDWIYQMIRQVGNYGEIFNRNVGAGSSLKMERNLNELWNRGGLHYAPSVR